MDLKKSPIEDKSSDEDDVGSQVSEITSSDEDYEIEWEAYLIDNAFGEDMIRTRSFIYEPVEYKSLDEDDIYCPVYGRLRREEIIKAFEVQDLNDETSTVEASRYETAKDVKTKASEKLRLSNEIYRSIDNGEELDAMSTFSSLDIPDESEFHLLPQLGLVRINVQVLSGETCTVEARRSETAKDVKAKACEKLRLSTESCTLVFNGKELDDMSDLSSVDTSVECKFQLLPKTGLGLVDSVKTLFEYFRNGAHLLVEWFSEFLMDKSRVLTEKDLSRISQAVGKGWQHLGAELGISQAEIEQICEDNRKTSMKIFNMLRQWSIKDSVNATVNTLHNAMKNCRKVTFDMKAIERVFAGI